MTPVFEPIKQTAILTLADHTLLPLSFKDDLAEDLLAIAICLALLAIATIVYVACISWAKRISLRGIFVGACSVLWLLPVIGVMAVLASRAAPNFRVEPKHNVESEADPAVDLGQGSESSDTSTDENDKVPNGEADADSDLPGWVQKPRIEAGEATLVVLKSGLYVTEEEATEDVLNKAVEILRDDFHQANSDQGAWTLSAEIDRLHAVRRRCVEKVSQTIGGRPAQMHRVYLQVELSPDVRAQIYPIWRSAVVDRRLWSLGSIFGLLGLTFAATATYLHLDTATSGAYRRRLKFAAVSLIVAGGLAAAAAV